MTVFQLASQKPELLEHLKQNPLLCISCLCAQWCSACRHYQDVFQELARHHPQLCFVWWDIEETLEENENMSAAVDQIELFPCILIENATGCAFFGSVPPEGAALDRLIRHALRYGQVHAPNSPAPSLRAALLKQAMPTQYNP